jgi:hypothetical protein
VRRVAQARSDAVVVAPIAVQEVPSAGLHSSGQGDGIPCDSEQQPFDCHLGADHFAWVAQVAALGYFRIPVQHGYHADQTSPHSEFP